MVVSVTLEARSAAILSNLENLARNANKGAHTVAYKPVSQGVLTGADKLAIRVLSRFQK